MGKTRGGRKRKGSGDDPSGSDFHGSGGPQEAAAFIAETPIDEPGDDGRNVETLKSLVEPGTPKTHHDGNS